MSIITTEIENEVDISEFSDEGFNVEQSINDAKEIYECLVSENLWLKGDFEDDYWELAKEHHPDAFRSFSFTEFNSSRFNKHLPIEFKEIVKCWIVHLLGKHTTGRAQIMHTLLLKAFVNSKGFSRKEKDRLLKYIEHLEVQDAYKHALIQTIFNFCDYADLEIAEDYIPPLLDLRDKLTRKDSVRQLPPSRYVLSFSYYLEKHFQNLMDECVVKEKIVKEILVIYPLILWWRLTNIIPIRATEFCLIERDCIFIDNEKHYIKLPRIKQKNPKRIQILDKVLIDEEMYQLIKGYIDLTDQFGETHTLISYRSVIHGRKNSGGEYAKAKGFNLFRINVLNSLIKRFYKIMGKTYDCEIKKEHRISANDTRHFAFVSLMMQGYSPIEIARLGGHSTVQAQYHYSAHMEYWIDCEVFKLMKKVKNIDSIKEQVGTIPKEVQLKAYRDDGTFKRKMKIGHCKDEEQRCETKMCYFCSHWGITPEEFLEKKEKIKSDIVAMKDNIGELTSVINNLNRQLLRNELDRRNPDLLTKIKTKANAVQSDLYKLALLSSKLGGGEVLDGEKISWT